MNNVDLRYNFPLGDQKVDLVTAGNETSDSIAIYQVNSATRQLEAIAGPTIHVGIAVYGSCMYHSPTTGKYYFFVTSQDGEVEQWELFANGGGQINGSLVRSFNVGSQAEGCVADDELAHFYISQESTGIWKYGAEPADGVARILVDTTDASGHLTADVEGLTLYYSADGGGYLIASSQGSDNYVIYQRQANNAYVTTFAIIEGNGIDAVSNTDGIDVTNFPLDCAAFPQGALVVHDGKNDTGNVNQNYKLVPWQEVANTVSPPLTIDTVWDPRQVGARSAFLSLIFYLPLVTTSSASTGPC
jgi:3-phytase